MNKEKFINGMELNEIEHIDHGSKVTVCTGNTDIIIDTLTTDDYELTYDFIIESTERAKKSKHFKDHVAILLNSDEVIAFLYEGEKKFISDLVSKIMILAKEMNQFNIKELNKLNDFLLKSYAIETIINLDNLK